MKRLLLFMILLLLFDIGARCELMNLRQQRIDTKEQMRLKDSGLMVLVIESSIGHVE